MDIHLNGKFEHWEVKWFTGKSSDRMLLLVGCLRPSNMPVYLRDGSALKFLLAFITEMEVADQTSPSVTVY